MRLSWAECKITSKPFSSRALHLPGVIIPLFNYPRALHLPMVIKQGYSLQDLQLHLHLIAADVTW